MDSTPDNRPPNLVPCDRCGGTGRQGQGACRSCWMVGMITPAKQRQVRREIQRERRDRLRKDAEAAGPTASPEVCTDCPDRECLFCPYGAAGFLLAAA